MSGDVKLQPLRIPSGWQISWNRFYEIDPPEIFTADHRDYFDEDMFFATYYSSESGRKIGLDLGWGSPHASGRYVLSVVHYTEIKIKESHKKVIKIRKERQTLSYRLEPNFSNDPANWETPILTTRSRVEIAEKMDEIFYDVVMNLNSKYWGK